MTQNNILNAADYADALLTAKRAKNLVFPLLLLMLLAQLALFFIARFTTVLNPMFDGSKGKNWSELVEYLIGMIDFFGIILALLMAGVLCLILKVLLVGRLLGVARMTSALICSMFLILLLFPWQSFLNNPTIGNDPVQISLGVKLPGVLYTWAEFIHPHLGAKFDAAGDVKFLILRWARFVGWPVVAILILLAIQAKSSRALRQALGNDILLPPTDPLA